MTSVLIDGRSLEHGSAQRGIGTYVRGLLEGMGTIGHTDQIELIASRTTRLVDNEARDLTVHRALPSLKRRLQPLADPLLVRKALSRLNPDLYHAVEYGQPWRSSVPTVVTVHDLIPFVFPHWYPWLRRERLWGKELISRADAVIADSEHTARDCEEIAHVQRDRITVVPLAAASNFSPQDPAHVAAVVARRHIHTPYILAAGTFTDPRKRLPLLLDIIRRVRRDLPVQLIICGSQGGRRAADIPGLIAQYGVEGCVHFVGYVPTEELVALYCGAAAIVVTSAYEGFGLPLLEGMATGRPVIAFDNSCVREVAGDGARLVTDGDGAAMAAEIRSLIENQAEANALGQRALARATMFTWERTARQTWAVYEKVWGK